MRNLTTLALLIGLVVPAAAHAEPDPLDLRSDGHLSRALVDAQTKRIAGGTTFGLGIAAFAGGLAAELSTFGEGFGYLTCRGAECRDLDAQLRPRQIGGGISMALGAAGVIGGAIVLVQGGNERKAALRQLSVSVAPAAGGGTGTVSFRF